MPFVVADPIGVTGHVHSFGFRAPLDGLGRVCVCLQELYHRMRAHFLDPQLSSRICLEMGDAPFSVVCYVNLERGRTTLARRAL